MKQRAGIAPIYGLIDGRLKAPNTMDRAIMMNIPRMIRILKDNTSKLTIIH